LISRKQEVIHDAYQQRVHLLKVREDMLRKINWKKTQQSNFKTLSKRQEQQKSDRAKELDEKLVEKVGIDGKRKMQLKNLQEELPIGGNLYFELNRIAYKNDIERRKR
jgi:hypothetical protein